VEIPTPNTSGNQEVFIFHQLIDSKPLVEVAQAHQPQNPEQVQFKSHVKYNTLKIKKKYFVFRQKGKGCTRLEQSRIFPYIVSSSSY
jgi:hypothetical protein